MNQPRSPLLRPFEKVLLFLGLVMFALILIQNRTGKVVQTVDNEVFTKGLTTRLPPPPPGVTTDPLPSIATIFSKKQHQDEPDFWAEVPLPEPEKDFYKSIRNAHKTDGTNKLERCDSRHRERRSCGRKGWSRVPIE